ncbi:hypothetical protein [Microbacterium dextranolyticum]|uniref:Integral membrane protein n=1 Tax=Microbacterium dextranolyticum TaxID=36806 RepID=A0A9W6HN87_9MICO|nr:hypothetical protein [Microbacterium dextranolyticum]MBM7462590.1 hypothetical protein [Microbacterium dextranolyticum]GLJ96307.1 hypothetical protein GCM10017591_23700 [Microbacterium dextranolyticum]
MSSSADGTSPRDDPRRRGRRPSPDLPAGEVREWLSSYVYGNITLLSAAIAVGPEQIEHGAAVWAVLATGLLTFLAHVLAHIVAEGYGEAGVARRPAARRAAMREVVRTARPIATSSLIPAALYVVAWIGWLPAAWMQTAAIVVLAVRIGFVGLSMQRFSGKPLTVGALWAGVMLALVSFGIGFAKVLLTH